MKQSFLSLLLLLSCVVSKAANNTALPANKVKLPPQAVLRKQLDAIDLDYFVQRTNICQDLAEKELRPDEIAFQVRKRLYDYQRDVLKYMSLDYVIAAYESKIIKCILQDHSHAIQELQDRDIV